MSLLNEKEYQIKLGIVIVNYNNWKETIQCIKSIWNQDLYQSYRIYIVDNASPIRPDIRTQEFFKSEDIEMIYSDENTGYATGNNIGIRKAIDEGCSKILISNSDIIFHDGCIQGLINGLKDNHDVGIIAPQIRNLDGTIDHRNFFSPMTLKEKYMVTTFFSHINPKIKRQYFGLDNDFNQSIYVYGVSGCCFMMSLDCVQKVTPFDENTFLYEEEYILSKTMELHKLKTLYLPSSVVTHAHGSSTNHVKAFSFICFVSSEIYYCKKYLNARVIQLLPLYVIRTMSYLVRAFKYKDFRKNIIRYFELTGLSIKS